MSAEIQLLVVISHSVVFLTGYILGMIYERIK